MKALSLPLFDINAKNVGTLELDATVFGVTANPTLVHQAIIAFLANRRAPIANTKDRSAVRGGGKKPWRQKGTGNARAGSSRSPIWRGGGITFGPTSDRNFSVRMPQKMRQSAWKSVLSTKVAADQVFLVDSLDSLDGKTKTWMKVVTDFTKTLPQTKQLLIVTSAINDLADRSIRNVEKHKYVTIENLTIYDLVNFPTVIMTQDAVTSLTDRLKSATKAKAVKEKA